jgi:hypothetical protein
MNGPVTQTLDPGVPERAAALFENAQSEIHRRIDRMFCWLLVIQWLGGIAAAF